MANEAQRILNSLGIATAEGAHKQAHGTKNASATKSGPGRYHMSGYEKAGAVKPHGAPVGFVVHHASPAKSERRAIVKAHGRRQALQMLKYWRSEERYARKLEDDERASYVAPDSVEYELA